MAEAQRIPIPRQGLGGIQSLIDLGAERLTRLGEIQLSRPLNLAFGKLISRLAPHLQCEESLLENAFVNALIPLNGLRRALELNAEEFLASISQTLETNDDLKQKYATGWIAISASLPPFFAPDNFFSQASKAFELLSLRPANFQGAKILNELRPIYNEATTKTLAVLQTNTLVLNYRDESGEKTVHITLDGEDLESLSSEIDRARIKLAISNAETKSWGAALISYGEPEGCDAEVEH